MTDPSPKEKRAQVRKKLGERLDIATASTYDLTAYIVRLEIALWEAYRTQTLLYDEIRKLRS